MASDSLRSEMAPLQAQENISVRTVVLSVCLPVVGIALGEYFMFFGDERAAFWWHFGTLVACLVGSLLFDEASLLFRLFVLLPLFRLVNLSMPVFHELTLLWLPLVYAALLPAIYVVYRSEPLFTTPSPWSVDTSHPDMWIAGLTVGSLFVSVVAVGEYRLLSPAALIPAPTVANLALLAVVQIGFVGTVEELLFRSVIQRGLQLSINRWAGLFVASGLFGLLHSAAGSELHLISATLIGLVFGLCYDWTDSLLTVAGVHGLLNVVLFGLLPFYELPV